jgi:hypothetical protein
MDSPATPTNSPFTFNQFTTYLRSRDAARAHLQTLSPEALIDLLMNGWEMLSTRLEAGRRRMVKYRQASKRSLASAFTDDSAGSSSPSPAAEGSSSEETSSPAVADGVLPKRVRTQKPWSVKPMWPWESVDVFLSQSLMASSVEIYKIHFHKWVEAVDNESHRCKQIMAESRHDPVAYLILHPALVRKIGAAWMSDSHAPLALATVDARVKFLCYMGQRWKRFVRHAGAAEAFPELQQYSAELSERVRLDQSRKAPAMKYEEWLAVVLEKCGAGSFEHLYAWWFMESPTRNDVFRIARSEAENDGKHNFVVIPHDKETPCTFIWNHSKTVVAGCKATESPYKLRGAYSPFVSGMLREMIERNPGRKWLFGKTKIDFAEFRRALTEKTGAPTASASINYQRRMLALWGREHLTPEEMVELHRKMQHSQTTGREVYEAAPLVTTSSNDAAPTEMAVN